MAKHTAGEWEASFQKTHWVITSPHYTYGLAQTLCHGMHFNQHMANAQLMAASPSLFHICTRLDAFFGIAFGVIPHAFPHAQEAQTLWDDTRKRLATLEKGINVEP